MRRASTLLKDREDELHKLADALCEYETLSLDEVRDVLAGKKLNRMSAGGKALQSETEKHIREHDHDHTDA